jgi:DNA-binding MarR family transcriptional regulator
MAPETAETTQTADVTDTTGLLADQLHRLTRRLRRAYTQRLAPLGITPAQMHVLRIVSHAEARGEQPPRMADLAARLDVVPRAVTTLVDALEVAGLARRVPDPANRRVVRVELTEPGGETVVRLRQARREAVEELLAPLSPAQRQSFSELLSPLDIPRRERPQPSAARAGRRTDESSAAGH